MSTAVAPVLCFTLASTVAFGPPGRTREHPGRLPWSRPECRAPFAVWRSRSMLVDGCSICVPSTRRQSL